MTNTPMMKCGCAAHAERILPDGSRIPACVVHGCIEVAETPDLGTRRARCAHYGQQTARRGSYGGGNECNYGQRESGVCTCEQPSSPDLPFFKYQGPGSPTATDKCKCGFLRQAHWPKWRASIRSVRRWYKIERHEEIRTEEGHCENEAAAQAWAEAMTARWLNWTKNPETKVSEAELISVEQIRNPLKCGKFTASGPQEFDEFYCGCHGWD